MSNQKQGNNSFFLFGTPSDGSHSHLSLNPSVWSSNVTADTTWSVPHASQPRDSSELHINAFESPPRIQEGSHLDSRSSIDRVFDDFHFQDHAEDVLDSLDGQFTPSHHPQSTTAANSLQSPSSNLDSVNSLSFALSHLDMNARDPKPSQSGLLFGSSFEQTPFAAGSVWNPAAASNTSSSARGSVASTGSNASDRDTFHKYDDRMYDKDRPFRSPGVPIPNKPPSKNPTLAEMLAPTQSSDSMQMKSAGFMPLPTSQYGSSPYHQSGSLSNSSRWTPPSSDYKPHSYSAGTSPSGIKFDTSLPRSSPQSKGSNSNGYGGSSHNSNASRSFSPSSPQFMPVRDAYSSGNNHYQQLVHEFSLPSTSKGTHADGNSSSHLQRAQSPPVTISLCASLPARIPKSASNSSLSATTPTPTSTSAATSFTGGSGYGYGAVPSPPTYQSNFKPLGDYSRSPASSPIEMKSATAAPGGKLCQFYLQGNCRYGDRCRNPHAVQSEVGVEMDPDEVERLKVLQERMNSKDVECGICYERILENNRRFGLLNACEHAFCLECIRSWRGSNDLQKDTVRACPLCRAESHFVIPCDRLVRETERKMAIIGGYKSKLSTIACKHYNYGDGACPFGSSCFYAHYNKDGTRVTTEPPRKYVDADGVVEVVKTIRLADFL
eukprot:GILK01005547.1.p1 GENE.GILK01005547.1~~GILK01005547.1.p1  ORF type:complete len:663 (-),score=43.21 GILK01005547.1:161-2149(-)